MNEVKFLSHEKQNTKLRLVMLAAYSQTPAIVTGRCNFIVSFSLLVFVVLGLPHMYI